jgi:prevent-host-death family protein
MFAPVKLSYSVYEAKTRLSEILRAVRRGLRVTITDRGREVARVVPIDEGDDLEQRLLDLAAAGIVTRAVRRELPEAGTAASRPGALGRFLRDRD